MSKYPLLVDVCIFSGDLHLFASLWAVVQTSALVVAFMIFDPFLDQYVRGDVCTTLFCLSSYTVVRSNANQILLAEKSAIWRAKDRDVKRYVCVCGSGYFHFAQLYLGKIWPGNSQANRKQVGRATVSLVGKIKEELLIIKSDCCLPFFLLLLCTYLEKSYPAHPPTYTKVFAVKTSPLLGIFLMQCASVSCDQVMHVMLPNYKYSDMQCLLPSFEVNGSGHCSLAKSAIIQLVIKRKNCRNFFLIWNDFNSTNWNGVCLARRQCSYYSNRPQPCSWLALMQAKKC